MFGHRTACDTSLLPCCCRTPAIPENPEDLSEEELEALQQQMDEDYELATGEGQDIFDLYYRPECRQMHLSVHCT